MTKNSVVYEIISSLPLPAENSTLDSGADDLATLGTVSCVPVIFYTFDNSKRTFG